MTDALCTATTNTDPNSNRTVYASRLCKPWAVSNDGLSFLAVWESGVLNGKSFLGLQVTEGFILTVYKDNRGLPTVGCGHLVVAADKLKVGDTITLDKAREFKKKAIDEIEARLNRDIRVPLFQFEYDSLVSILYNAGSFKGADEIIKKINSGHYDKLFDYILTYRIGHNNGLRPRRFSEARLFASGVYDASH
ncbi:lysozyme [Caballeronia arvi]|uniref:Lysozyme n=1 Tax=Caballeronia arvi TaxID=1777135 RepID=A0A158I7H1_9BURK|nr:lysozyme [Caballeronia arvi]SAL52209.1 lysozyme [Caballeronia arvi]